MKFSWSVLIKSRTLFFTTLVALFCCEILLARAQTKSPCLAYAPTVVKLTGKLVQETFPGPPNYESVRNGDRPETEWILELDNTHCVDEDKADPDLNPAQKAVRRIQLVFNDRKAYVKYKDLVSKKIMLTGTLFGGHTAHHHTNVLLTVGTLESLLSSER
jgi:uncharacterized protein DUF4431